MHCSCPMNSARGAGQKKKKKEENADMKRQSKCYRSPISLRKHQYFKKNLVPSRSGTLFYFIFNKGLLYSVLELCTHELYFSNWLNFEMHRLKLTTWAERSLLWSTGAYSDSSAGADVGAGLCNFWKSRVWVQWGAAIKKLLKIFLFIFFTYF